jgi:hypothetical protein
MSGDYSEGNSTALKRAELAKQIIPKFVPVMKVMLQGYHKTNDASTYLVPQRYVRIPTWLSPAISLKLYGFVWFTKGDIFLIIRSCCPSFYIQFYG